MGDAATGRQVIVTDVGNELGTRRAERRRKKPKATEIAG